MPFVSISISSFLRRLWGCFPIRPPFCDQGGQSDQHRADQKDDRPGKRDLQKVAEYAVDEAEDAPVNEINRRQFLTHLQEHPQLFGGYAFQQEIEGRADYTDGQQMSLPELQLLEDAGETQRKPRILQNVRPEQSLQRLRLKASADEAAGRGVDPVAAEVQRISQKIKPQSSAHQVRRGVLLRADHADTHGEHERVGDAEIVPQDHVPEEKRELLLISGMIDAESNHGMTEDHGDDRNGLREIKIIRRAFSVSSPMRHLASICPPHFHSGKPSREPCSSIHTNFSQSV